MDVRPPASFNFKKLPILKKQLNKFLLLAIILTTALVLAGCAKVVLYSNLHEKEVNQMMAILLSRNIEAEKIALKDNMWQIDVSQAQMAQAVEVLSSYGYPTDQYQSIGEVFKKNSLVSSPSEERIRFMYALSQSVAETLSQIDGVLTARVHVVLQNNDPLSDIKTLSSASVFIRYRRGSGVEALASQIKRLVANSIEGLNYDKISLIFVPAETNQGVVMPAQTEHQTGFDTRFWLIISLGVLLLLIVLGAAGAYWYMQGGIGGSKKSLPRENENR